MDNQLANYQYLYLHGFASSPQSRKAVHFVQKYQQLGIKLNIIDFNQPDFADLTLTRQINQVNEFVQQKAQQQFILIGSSFGGLTANWVAQQSTANIKALILLAPALNFRTSWLHKIPPQTLAQWQKEGSLPIYHYGENKELLLNYLFWQDLQTYDDRLLNHKIPTLIFHGINDEVISIEVSRTYTQQNSHVALTELNSDHSLNDSQDQIYQEMIDWLSLIISCNN